MQGLYVVVDAPAGVFACCVDAHFEVWRKIGECRVGNCGYLWFGWDSRICGRRGKRIDLGLLGLEVFTNFQLWEYSRLCAKTDSGVR